MKKLIFALALSMAAFSVSAANDVVPKKLVKLDELKSAAQAAESKPTCVVTLYWYDYDGNQHSVTGSSSNCGRAMRRAQRKLPGFAIYNGGGDDNQDADNDLMDADGID